MRSTDDGCYIRIGKSNSACLLGKRDVTRLFRPHVIVHSYLSPCIYPAPRRYTERGQKFVCACVCFVK